MKHESLFSDTRAWKNFKIVTHKEFANFAVHLGRLFMSMSLKSKVAVRLGKFIQIRNYIWHFNQSFWLVLLKFPESGGIFPWLHMSIILTDVNLSNWNWWLVTLLTSELEILQVRFLFLSDLRNWEIILDNFKIKLADAYLMFSRINWAISATECVRGEMVTIWAIYKVIHNVRRMRGGHVVHALSISCNNWQMALVRSQLTYDYGKKMQGVTTWIISNGI